MTTSSFQINAAPKPRIAISNSEGTWLFQTDEITRLQACSNYTFIHFVNRKPMLISKVLKTYEEILVPLGFIRTHQSHLVNKRHIRFMGRQGSLEMLDNTKVDVSRSKRKLVLAALRSMAMPEISHDQTTMLAASA